MILNAGAIGAYAKEVFEGRIHLVRGVEPSDLCRSYFDAAFSSEFPLGWAERDAKL